MPAVNGKATSITSSLTVDDWLEVINGQAGAPFGTAIGSGEPVRSGDFPRTDQTGESR